MRREELQITIPLVDLQAQYFSIKEEIDEAIQRVLNSGQFIKGEEVEAFEQEFADYVGTKYAVGVGSGTDALYLALAAKGIGEDDKVVTTPFTFIATLEAIVRCGATPVFVDIDETLNIDVAQVNQTQADAVLPVHLFGQPVDIGHINDKLIIEDCAQAMGAKVGLTTGCFSFFPSKNLGAYGDGGMVTTNDTETAKTVRTLANHCICEGLNSRLDALQAAILRVKLRHLDDWVSLRRSRAWLYCKLLDIPFNPQSSYNYFTIRHPGRDRLQDWLREFNIQSKVYYPSLLAEGDFPQAKKAAREVLSLPIYPELTDEQVKYIVSIIKQYV